MRWAVLAFACAGCLDVAEERTAYDAEVGRASADGVEVVVDEGLAAVRALGRNGLVLWAAAPRIDFTITFPAGTPSPFALSIDNALADAELSGPAGPIASAAALVPTEKRFSLDPPAGGGTVRLRLSPTDAEVSGRFRFAAFADVQEDIGRVQDIYARMNRDPQIRFAIVNGDLTRRGSGSELARFQRELKSLRVPTYATLGNHELGVRQGLFHEYFGRGNFRFSFRGAQITMLDSASATLAPTAYRWLDGWLAEAAGRLHIVTMHIPPLDPIGTRNGAFASRAEAGKLLARLAEGAVDLTVYGHLHSYYAFSNAGIPAFITGGGGALPERFDGIGRHYLTIDVDSVSGIIETALVRVD